jgi:hypothetical protein
MDWQIAETATVVDAYRITQAIIADDKSCMDEEMDEERGLVLPHRRSLITIRQFYIRDEVRFPQNWNSEMSDNKGDLGIGSFTMSRHHGAHLTARRDDRIATLIERGYTIAMKFWVV